MESSGYWNLLVLLCCGHVFGMPGQGRAVWEKMSLVNPLNESQLFDQGTFPRDFLWGVGSSSLQVEDDHSSRGQSVWDQFMRTRQSWLAHQTAGQPEEVSTTFLRRELPALELLGVDFYHFSLSWPRLFPEGDHTPSQQGVLYYNQIINVLLSKGMEPVITLYHWDLPATIQDKYGGWANDSVIQLFHDYATFCFQQFGDRVKYWITMHNPYLVASHGYGTGTHAPWVVGDQKLVAAVAHNLIKAHAMAWHTYNTHFRPMHKGYVSVTLGSHWTEPELRNADSSSINNCQEIMETVLGHFAQPIHGNGDYPESLKRRNGSSLPIFSELEKSYIQGTADFFAFSFGPNNFKRSDEMSGRASLNLRGVLNWIKLEYNNPRILIMENGWFANSNIKTEDTTTLYIMKKFLYNVLQAIKFDGVQVFGYTAWSLMDSFEWQDGYKFRRGLFYVDFQNKDKALTPKTSALYYKQVIIQNGFSAGSPDSAVNGRFPCDYSWGVTDSVLKAELTPSSPQFVDHRLYMWNITGDGALHAVKGVKLKTRPPQCTDFVTIRKQLSLLTNLKVTHYRFALNWSLILPRGDLSTINREVVRYYRCIIEEALKRGIRTMLVLYHPNHGSLNLPSPLMENGGWLNRTVVESFTDYARLCFQEFGDLVKQWITINEPNRLSQYYVHNSNRTYQAVHNALIAHATAWHLYDQSFRLVQKGHISLSLHTDWAEPANPFLQSHAVAAERFLLFDIAWIAEPIFGSGDYPVLMRQHILMKNQRGLSRSVLPHFTEEEKKLLKGSADFLAINHFTTRLIVHEPKNDSRYDADRDIHFLTDVTILSSDSGLPIVPHGIRKLLNWLKKNYGNIPIYITANGVDDKVSDNDKLRMFYLEKYNKQLLQAYLQDKINLKGYYAFKLTDKTKPQYGFYNSPTFNMRAKASVNKYGAMISANGFPLENQTEDPCKATEEENSCHFCTFIQQKKPLIFFSFCLFSMAVLLLTVSIVRKYKRKKRKLPSIKQQHNAFFLIKKEGGFSQC